MNVLWVAGTATVHEIRAHLFPQRPLAYTTIMTVMDRLARKGIVDRKKRGRAHLYRPVVPKEAVSERALTQLVENFFGGSREELRKHLEEPTRPIPKGVLAGRDSASPATAPAPRADGESKVEGVIDASLL